MQEINFKNMKVFLPVLMSFAFCSLLHLLSYRKKQFVRSLGKGTHLTVVAETFSKCLVLYKYNTLHKTVFKKTYNLIVAL